MLSVYKQDTVWCAVPSGSISQITIEKIQFLFFLSLSFSLGIVTKTAPADLVDQAVSSRDYSVQTDLS